MKYPALLLALSVTSAQAETILMTCGDESFRYSDGFLSLGTPTYERRKGAKWVPFCEPFEKPNARAICRPGEKGMVAEYLVLTPKGEWEGDTTQTIDFEVLMYKNTSINTLTCKRLNRG